MQRSRGTGRGEEDRKWPERGSLTHPKTAAASACGEHDVNRNWEVSRARRGPPPTDRQDDRLKQPSDAGTTRRPEHRLRPGAPPPAWRPTSGHLRRPALSTRRPRTAIAAPPPPPTQTASGSSVWEGAAVGDPSGFIQPRDRTGRGGGVRVRGAAGAAGGSGPYEGGARASGGRGELGGVLRWRGRGVGGQLHWFSSSLR